MTPPPPKLQLHRGKRIWVRAPRARPTSSSTRCGAMPLLAVVTAANGRWHPAQIVGIISKERVADLVAATVKSFA